MKLKLNRNKQVLAPEGVHCAKVNSIRPKGEGKVVIDFEFTVDGKVFVASKEYKAKLDCGSELLRDAEVLLGRTLECTDTDLDVDLDLLLGATAQVLVIRKRSSGGKMIAPVETVLPAVVQATVAA